MENMTPDLSQAKRHLQALDPLSEKFVFQTFDDSANKAGELARVIYGAFDKCVGQLTELNRRGAGVFVTVNQSRNEGRKKEDIISYRAIFREADEPNLPELPIKPHFVVESSPGKKHEYIFLVPVSDGEIWDRIMQTMVEQFGSDKNAKDRSRVLRLAGFYHRKSTPHMVKIIHESKCPALTLSEVTKHIHPAKAKITPKVSATVPGKYGASALARELSDLACAQEKSRNDSLNRAAYSLGQLVAGGEIDKAQVETALFATALSIGLSEGETRATIRSGMESGMKDPRNAPEVTKKPEKEIKKTDSTIVKTNCLISPTTLRNEVFTLFDRGENRGFHTGWNTLNPFYTVKTGEMTVITGIPGSGKSNFVDAMMVNLMKTQEWRFAVFSPENWPVQRHLQSLIEKIEGMPFAKAGRYTPRLDRGVLDGLLETIDGYFQFIVPDEEELLTVENVLATAKIAVEKHGVKGLVIDPWNELDHQYENKSEAQYLSEKLTRIRRFARMNGVHIWIVAHPKNLIKEKDGGYRPPTMYEISGGAHWRNKADNGICVHRPDYNVDETEIYIQKIRFREVGKVGMTKLSYCRDTGTYDDIQGFVQDEETGRVITLRKGSKGA